MRFVLFFIESTTIDEYGDVLENNITRTVYNMLLHMEVVLSYGLGAISRGHKTVMVVIDGNLDARAYLDNILHPHVLPYAAGVGHGFVCMDDNARPHRQRIVNAFF